MPHADETTVDRLPIIDLSGYLNPKSPEDRAKVITQVRDAASRWGFFQIKNHGVPMSSQVALWESIKAVMGMPQEEKDKLSFLKDARRRGYEKSGDSVRVGDALPDAKEAFFIGREVPLEEQTAFHGPNQWPDLPEEVFHGPVWKYYGETVELGKTIWELLLEGLGHPASTLGAFAKKPMVIMKMIRYPPSSTTQQGQFGIGAHNDFGGVTVLLQQPGKVGLEVWDDIKEQWIQVPALEDVFIINCGDMIMNWSGKVYKSARHRVINRGTDVRLSCATFWHGDAAATNPLNPNDPSKETVGSLLVKRFGTQYSLPEAMRLAG